jgi:hypothetical protein
LTPCQFAVAFAQEGSGVRLAAVAVVEVSLQEYIVRSNGIFQGLERFFLTPGLIRGLARISHHINKQDCSPAGK